LAAENPLQLGVGGNRGLIKEGAAGGVEADGKEGRQHLALANAENGGVVLGSDGVKVNDAEDETGVCIGFIVELFPRLQRAKVVPNMWCTRGLDPREDYSVRR